MITLEHHKKSIIFRVGLLSKETIETYQWLLIAFLSAHEGKEPKVVLIYQDAIIKQVVGSVFPKSKHKLYMLLGIYLKTMTSRRDLTSLNTKKELDHETKKAVYKFYSPQQIEKHVVKVYTNTLFYEAQKRNIQRFLVMFIQKCWNREWIRILQSTIKLPEKDIKHSYEHFNHFGTLFRYRFNIMMKHGIKEILYQYIES
uniref:MULE transposase domain-containing protein n=1 Tax=Lactuca sativa TaxID=4236 RepID=A0A9R1XCZ5_LACSA|nr:hypothetical protein LSAT_V11C500290310 [Lactuca sativa]